MKFAILLASMCAVFGSDKTTVTTAVPLQGDYVEARSASVYCGPCHYNSELMTSGRDAVMAWNFTSGSWDQVNLAGVRVMAVVSSDENLISGTPHRSEIAVDTSATAAQAKAAVEAIRARCVKTLGNVLSVRRIPITFTKQSENYDVSAKGFADLSVEAMPDATCCLQPNDICYSPLISMSDRNVGYTDEAAYDAGTLGYTWERSGENSSFYGTFKFN